MHESIELQMSLLLAVALAGHLISSLVRQPAVVGQILAGLIVGPSVFGWITYTTFVANIAHLGAIVLLFVVGLEFRARELAAVRPFLIAVAGVVVPWLAGLSAGPLVRLRDQQRYADRCRPECHQHCDYCRYTARTGPATVARSQADYRRSGD